MISAIFVVCASCNRVQALRCFTTCSRTIEAANNAAGTSSVNDATPVSLKVSPAILPIAEAEKQMVDLLYTGALDEVLPSTSVAEVLHYLLIL